MVRKSESRRGPRKSRTRCPAPNKAGAAVPGNPITLAIDSIIIGDRTRKEPGDIEGLADNVHVVGLVQPVAVTPGRALIDGWRRLLAFRLLGWTEVPVRVVDLEKIADGEFSANSLRQPYTTSECVAIWQKVKPLVQAEAKERQKRLGREGGKAGGRPRKTLGENGPKGFPSGTSRGRTRGKTTEDIARMSRGGRRVGRTRDIIAQSTGGQISGKQLEKAVEVMDYIREHPELAPLQEAIDRGVRSIEYRYRYVRGQKVLATIEDKPPEPGKYGNEILHGDCLAYLRQWEDKTFDAVITDPPFGIGLEYHDGIERIDRSPEEYWAWLGPIYREMWRVLKPGGFFAMFLSPVYFRHFWAWLGDDITIYAACKDSVPHWKLAKISHAWTPVVIEYKPGAKALRPRKNHRTLDHYTCRVTKTDDLARLHPCPLSDDQCDELILAYTMEYGWVLDPFCGSGQIPLACLRHGRRFTGVDQNAEYARAARKRIAAFTHGGNGGGTRSRPA